jgi:peptide/nickel transport system substrate-binding protein
MVVSILLSMLAACTPATPIVVPTPTEGQVQAQEPTKTSEPAKPAEPTATSAPISKYNEAPQLAEMVKAGTLPPVEDRLPAEPLVVTPLNEVGQYGGTQRGPAYGPKIGQLDTAGLRRQALVNWNTDFQTLYANVLKEYSASDDFTTWTLVLRKGMKYSDGQPFTADDFVFWYEDILQNTDLTPTIPTNWAPGGKLMKLAKVDDVTITVTFENPNPNFDLAMVRSYENNSMFAPKHYLSKWHIKYNDKANDVAKEEKFETWAQAFLYHVDRYQSQADPNIPDINPWVLSKIDDLGNKYFDRNPYYWAVDTAGNQLPYIDQQIAIMVKDKDVRNLKLIAQELDNAGENPLPVADYTLYKENEEKGNYKVYLFENTRGSDVGIALNLTHKDPVLREIFTNIHFREALSMAINRQQVNEVRAFGKATLRQATIPPSVSFYEEWMGNYFIEFSTDKANALLDEMGLEWNAGKTVRMRPDGKPLELVMETWEEFAPFAELVSEMWTAVGVKTSMKQIERTLWDQRVAANELDAMAYPYDSVAEPVLRAQAMSRLRPGYDYQMPLWKDWLNSAGAKGEEPPAEIKELYDLCMQFSVAKPGSAEYKELGLEIATRYTKSLYSFGIYLGPRVMIFSNNLGNTPTEGIFANDYGFWDPYRGDQWYFK